jgi:hypothetical protein
MLVCDDMGRTQYRLMKLRMKEYYGADYNLLMTPLTPPPVESWWASDEASMLLCLTGLILGGAAYFYVFGIGGLVVVRISPEQAEVTARVAASKCKGVAYPGMTVEETALKFYDQSPVVQAAGDVVTTLHMALPAAADSAATAAQIATIIASG